jgi:hypothetical protein
LPSEALINANLIGWTPVLFGECESIWVVATFVQFIVPSLSETSIPIGLESFVGTFGAWPSADPKEKIGGEITIKHIGTKRR